jgi:4,5-DOPA dioxygenase extradiol
MFLTLGVAQRPDDPPQTTIDGWMYGLSRRSFQVA